MAKKQVEEVVVEIEIGSTVRFLGYDESTEEKDRLLDEDGEYEVIATDEQDGETTYIVKAPNPSYDAKKRAGKGNQEFVEVEVFADEIELAEEGEEEQEEEAPKAKPRAAAKASAKSKAKAKEEEEEEEEQEEAPAKTTVKGKAASKAPAKTTVKGKAASKTSVKGKAAAKKEKTEPVEKIDPLDVDLENEDEEIKELCESADDLLALAVETVEDASAIEYRLGGVLYHVRKSKAYQELDERYTQKANPASGQLSGFQLYTQEQLGVDYRKAMNLIEIYVNFNLAGIAGDKVAEIGWTKASKIASVLKSKVKAGDSIDDVTKVGEELVEAAGEQTVTELVDTIKESYTSAGGTQGERKKMITFKFKVFEDQAENIKAIIEGAAAELGVKLDQAFEHIVNEWGVEHPLQEKASATEKKASTRTAGKAAGRTAGKASARASARA